MNAFLIEVTGKTAPDMLKLYVIRHLGEMRHTHRDKYLLDVVTLKHLKKMVDIHTCARSSN